MRYFSLLCLILIALSGTALPEMSFKATVDKLGTAYEERIQLQLEVIVSDPMVKTTPIPPPEIIGFRIGGSGSSVERRGDLIVRKYLYDLVPARSGAVTIPSFKVEFLGATSVDTLSSDPITVEVASPRPVGKGGLPASVYVIVGIVLVAGALGFVVWRRRSRVKEPAAPDWRDEYRTQFAEIKKIAERQDFRTFSGEVMRLITAIMEQTHDAKLTGFTSGDILRWLGERDDDFQCLELCTELFDFCEAVRFSTGKVDLQEGMKALNIAEKIVELLLK